MGFFYSNARSRIHQEEKRGGKNGGDWSVQVERRLIVSNFSTSSLSAPLHRDGNPIKRTAGFFPATSHCGVKAGRSPDISR